MFGFGKKKVVKPEVSPKMKTLSDGREVYYDLNDDPDCQTSGTTFGVSRPLHEVMQHSDLSMKKLQRLNDKIDREMKTDHGYGIDDLMKYGIRYFVDGKHLN